MANETHMHRGVEIKMAPGWSKLATAILIPTGWLSASVVGIGFCNSGSEGLGSAILILGLLGMLARRVTLLGDFTLQPNQAKVLILFGESSPRETSWERRAAMVSNLRILLCGDGQPQPVINAGTLYA
jgi:hypothetical protein